MQKYTFNLKEAAEYTGIGEWTLRKCIYDGKLKVYKPTSSGKSTKVLIKRTDLEEMVEKGEVD
jgi:excisionase family DNA binding protein